MVWHDTRALDVKVLQVDHGLDAWVVYHSPHAGQGVVVVLSGTSPTPPKIIYKMLRVEGVVQVASGTLDGKEDYFAITVHDPRFWNQIKADIGTVVLEKKQ